MPRPVSAAADNRAFTLVELLVVVGIIAVLIAILLPALSKARAAAQEAVCLSNLHQIGIGLIMYCDQNHGLVPQKGPDGSDAADNLIGVPDSAAPGTYPNGVTGLDDASLWFNAVATYTGKRSYYQLLLDDQAGTPLPTSGKSSVFVCPSANGVGTIGGGQAGDVLSADGQYFLLYGNDPSGKLRPITSPGPGPFFKFGLSYVINGSLTNTYGNTQKFSTVHLGKLRPGSAVVLVMEKLVNAGEYLDPAVQKMVRETPAPFAGLVSTAGFISNVAQPKGNWKRFTTRHNGGGNLLFADGHATYWKWRETQIQPDQLPYKVGSLTATGSDANQYSRIIWSVVGPIQ